MKLRLSAWKTVPSGAVFVVDQIQSVIQQVKSGGLDDRIAKMTMTASCSFQIVQ